MDHTCYRCGEPVADGVAFCENCRAPQIRVAIATESQSATPPLPPGTPGELQPPARPVGSGYPPPPPRPYESAPKSFSWHDAIPGAIVAGGVTAILGVFPPIGVFLWPIVAGALGVILYRRRVPEASIPTGTGARIGAASGLFGFIVFFVLRSIAVAMVGMDEFVKQAFENTKAWKPDPEVQAQMQQFLTPAGIVIMCILAGVLILALFLGLSTLGGMLGAKLVKKPGPGNRV